jgi:hypothetical protein
VLALLLVAVALGLSNFAAAIGIGSGETWLATTCASEGSCK